MWLHRVKPTGIPGDVNGISIIGNIKQPSEQFIYGQNEYHMPPGRFSEYINRELDALPSALSYSEWEKFSVELRHKYPFVIARGTETTMRPTSDNPNKRVLAENNSDIKRTNTDKENIMKEYIDIAVNKLKLFEKYKLPGWTMIANNHVMFHDGVKETKSWFGHTSYSKQLITLHTDATSNNTDREAFDTIMHEIAHAIRDKYTYEYPPDTEEYKRTDGHDLLWTKIFMRIYGSSKYYGRGFSADRFFHQVYAFHCQCEDATKCFFSIHRDQETFRQSSAHPIIDTTNEGNIPICAKHKKPFVFAYLTDEDGFGALENMDDRLSSKVKTFTYSTDLHRFKVNMEQLCRIDLIEYLDDLVETGSFDDDKTGEIEMLMNELKNNPDVTTDRMTEILRSVQPSKGASLVSFFERRRARIRDKINT